MKKLVSILFIIIILTVFCSSIVLASSGEVIGAVGGVSSNNGWLNTIAGQVLSIVQIAGSAVAAIMLVVIAIRYMSAAPSDKADVKKQLIGYIIGVIILISIVVLVSIFAAMGEQVSGMA